MADHINLISPGLKNGKCGRGNRPAPSTNPLPPGQGEFKELSPPSQAVAQGQEEQGRLAGDEKDAQARH